eukprot:jgi/Phyca11/106903/e_gw1.13.450.1
MLLGHKTRIDKTIAGLLQHQMTITQKIVFTIGHQHSTSHAPKTEWERFVNLMAGAFHHLPCRHMMHLAESGLRLNMLPVTSIDKRWSLSVALDAKE